MRTGPFDEVRLQKELQADFAGVAAARYFRQMNVGLIGQVYPGMTDMPIDEHRLLRVTGRMMAQPEVEEIEEAYRRVTDDQLEEMYTEFRRIYAVDFTVTNEHMRFSAQLAGAYDEVIRRHEIDAFGYY